MKISELFLNETAWRSEPGLKPEDASFIRIYSSGQKRAAKMKDLSSQGFAYTTNRKTTPFKLPFDFSNIDMPFCNVFCTETEYLPTLEGFPRMVNIFDLNVHVIDSKSFIGAPLRCKTVCSLNSHNVFSLQGIGKDYCIEAKTLRISSTIKSHMLGVLKIKGLQSIEKMHFGIFSTPRFDKAFTIIEKHLKDKRDILACQIELIENDLEEYAQL